jgi:signal transduction histidine kinase
VGGWHRGAEDARVLDAGNAMTDNSRNVEGGQVEALHASRRRLLLAGDAERRRIERELHEGVQQHLVALAVNLQLARNLTDSDPAAARTLLVEMGRDVQQALDETAQVAQRIYPQLDAVGFAALLRSAAVNAGIPASVDTDIEASPRPELLATVYWCWLEVLDRSTPGARPTMSVREHDGALVFEIVADGEHAVAALEDLADRVEALGGTLTIQSEPDARTSVSGSLPLAG